MKIPSVFDDIVHRSSLECVFYDKTILATVSVLWVDRTVMSKGNSFGIMINDEPLH